MLTQERKEGRHIHAHVIHLTVRIRCASLSPTYRTLRLSTSTLVVTEGCAAQARDAANTPTSDWSASRRFIGRAFISGTGVQRGARERLGHAAQNFFDRRSGGRPRSSYRSSFARTNPAGRRVDAGFRIQARSNSS